MKKIYLAGPLFTEYEQKQRKYEADLIREYISEKNLEIEIFSPLEAPINGSTQPTQDVIFETDATEMDESKIFFFDMSNDDAGTMMEMGMVIQRVRTGETDIKIYPVESDFRIKYNSRLGLESTWGGNSFNLGAFRRYEYEIFTSFEDAFNAFKKDHK